MLGTTYILNRTKILADGTLKSVEQSYHKTLLEAQTKYHRNISTDMSDETLKGSISIITDTKGLKYDDFEWERDEEPQKEAE